MTLTTFDRIIRDRGSVYAVSGGPVADRAAIEAALAALTAQRRFAKATHNSWAARIGGEGCLAATLSLGKLPFLVVRQRSRRLHTLLGVGDGRGLGGADPDGQVAGTVALTEQDDGLRRGHLDADSEDIEQDHGPHRSRPTWERCRTR